MSEPVSSLWSYDGHSDEPGIIVDNARFRQV